MSARLRAASAAHRQQAHVLAALGEETRLSLVARLATGERQSITALARGSRLTRQAISKHLGVLERAGIVRGVRAGREHVYEFRPAPIADLTRYLDEVAGQWDAALARLKVFVED
jgi:DNA-binding transcriptional ArsR family regulator